MQQQLTKYERYLREMETMGRKDALNAELDSMLIKSATLQKLVGDTATLDELTEMFASAFSHIAWRISYITWKIKDELRHVKDTENTIRNEGFIPSTDFNKLSDEWVSSIPNQEGKITAQSILDVGVESGILITKYVEGSPIVVGFSKEEYLHHLFEMGVTL